MHQKFEFIWENNSFASKGFNSLGPNLKLNLININNQLATDIANGERRLKDLKAKVLI